MKNKKELKKWLTDFQLPHPLVIAGPCSAETEEQVLTIAHELKDTDATVLRAGIWKPRTRPGNFEGVGAIGLKWLQRAKTETGLLTAIEVANPTHVELALKHDIDILWIGARSAVSPFIVQEIAEALQGTNKIVLVKNPVNPDLALWLGAVERLYASDIKKLGVIHRGFSSYEKTRYRNNPQWQIPIDIQTAFPDLPLLLDPSHIAGRRDIIFELCQTALDLNYDGFMIEVHHTPDKAWSDAKQQLTPQDFIKVIKNLTIRKENSKASDYINKIKLLRTQIEDLDTKIVNTFGERMKVAEKIGDLKRKNNVTILQSKRWNEIMVRMIAEGKQNNLSEEFMVSVFKAIHHESINHQKK